MSPRGVKVCSLNNLKNVGSLKLLATALSYSECTLSVDLHCFHCHSYLVCTFCSII